MPRPCRVFTDEEVQTVRRMQEAGERRDDIAKSLNMTSSSFSWHMQCGRFGNLQRQPGRRAGSNKPLQKADIEEQGQIFGCPANEWQLRKIEIRDSWPEDEMQRRAAGELPNRADNYSTFKKNNPHIQPEQPGRKERWPRKF